MKKRTKKFSFKVFLEINCNFLKLKSKRDLTKRRIKKIAKTWHCCFVFFGNKKQTHIFNTFYFSHFLDVCRSLDSTRCFYSVFFGISERILFLLHIYSIWSQLQYIKGIFFAFNKNLGKLTLSVAITSVRPIIFECQIFCLATKYYF